MPTHYESPKAKQHREAREQRELDARRYLAQRAETTARNAGRRILVSVS